MSSKTTPRDFFLYVAAMVTLYVSTFSVLRLVFSIINTLYPDRIYGFSYDPSSASIRFAIASLIVVFPLYIYITRRLNRDLAKNPAKNDMWVRRWLIYFTLFVAGAIIAGSLITTLNIFLNGEITTRFLLKVGSMLIVTSAIFSYYRYDLGRDPGVVTSKLKSFGVVVPIVVLALVVGGFVIMGTPGEQRDLRFDQQRVQHLENIQRQVVSYWQDKGSIPTRIKDLNDSIRGYFVTIDPETDQPYVYEKTGEHSFRLCAVFALESKEKSGRDTRDIGKPTVSELWGHDMGLTCFDRTIDPDIYPYKNAVPKLPGADL
ncbi:hypothetical protein COB55_01250 [Candidatus Wolfebacteria bacterium]|nr:MAG: hypothetical protein COB55_01250 [Candidatus Wolfebacteria bacterium]